MEFFKNHPLYVEDVKYVSSLNLPWEKFEETKILISGVSGMIGTFLLDVLQYKILQDKIDCKVFGLVRNLDRASSRFEYLATDNIKLIQHDVNQPLEFEGNMHVDYIVHLASNTHPVAYSNEPISTITTNVIGTNNLLDFASKNNCRRFVFASSNEIYGENRGDVEFFDESYCGYIDSNTLRAGYPESKRCGEALCQAYLKQKGLDVVIPRLTRTYGPTMLLSDTKAISQFLQRAIGGEDIVLKSKGNQYYSFLHVVDSVSGLLTIMLKGNSGEAYNIADEASDIRLKDLARLMADYVGKKVIFDLPDVEEKLGYSKATKARLNGAKVKALGWKARYSIEQGIGQTIDILSKGFIND